MKDSLKKLGDDYGLTPEGVRHAIEVYQDIICEITGGLLSKLTYDADIILEKAEEHYERKYGKSGEIGMSGAELIKWIQDHNAEDYQIIVYRDGYTDSLGCGLDDPDDNEKIIYI